MYHGSPDVLLYVWQRRSFVYQFTAVLEHASENVALSARQRPLLLPLATIVRCNFSIQEDNGTLLGEVARTNVKTCTGQAFKFTTLNEPPIPVAHRVQPTRTIGQL